LTIHLHEILLEILGRGDMDCGKRTGRHTIAAAPAAAGVDHNRFVYIKFDNGADFARLARLARLTALTNRPIHFCPDHGDSFFLYVVLIRHTAGIVAV
jgi:hypothetical protein